MRFRQVHLDFHTSEFIPDLGSQFDESAFAAAFQKARVNSVNLCAKCHHGYSYHPTDVGERHPGLDTDLLGRKIEALQSIGIKTPIYLSANWDELAARQHPEWRVVSPDGSLPRQLADPHGAGWAFLDFASGYLDYFCRQIAEVMENYSRGDGMWIDICWQPISVSEATRRAMSGLNLDWTCPGDQAEFNTYIVNHFFERVRDTIKERDLECPLFFNSGHIHRGRREHYAENYSHLEIESLPTGGWGYDHFPLSARYAETTGKSYLGMTGRFHTHWGEFGGYKKNEALIYECATMLAHGAGCSIGDHLHPTGKIDESSMAIIEAAYKWVEEREQWVKGSQAVADIAVLSVEAAAHERLRQQPDKNSKVDEGTVRVLLEGHFLFDVVDPLCDISHYKLLILPDDIDVDDRIARWVDAFVAQGGRVLLTGRSGIKEGAFVWDVGAKWVGKSTMIGGDYALPIKVLRPESISDPIFLYAPTEQISVVDGLSLGDVYAPYLDRSPKQFSGHLNAAQRPCPTGYDLGSAKGSYVYFSAPIFRIYREIGAVAHQELAANLVRLAMRSPCTVKADLPMAARITMRRQKFAGRDTIHILFATPVLTGKFQGKNICPIQDLVPLHDVKLEIRTKHPVLRVQMVPDHTELDFTERDGTLTICVPRILCHAMVEITYGQER